MGWGKQCPETCHLRKGGRPQAGARALPPPSEIDLPGLPGRGSPANVFTAAGWDAAPKLLAHSWRATQQLRTPRHYPGPRGDRGSLGPGARPRTHQPRQSGLYLGLPIHLVNAAIKCFSHGFLGLLLTPQAAATALLTANGSCGSVPFLILIISV